MKNAVTAIMLLCMFSILWAEETKTYRDYLSRFEITYPSGWSVKERFDESAVRYIDSSYEEGVRIIEISRQQEPWRPIRVEAFPNLNNYTLLEWVKDYSAFFPMVNLEINGKEAISVEEILVTCPPPPEPCPKVIKKTIFIMHRGMIYEISAALVEGDLSLDAEIFMQIVGSINFIDDMPKEWGMYISEELGFKMGYPKNWFAHPTYRGVDFTQFKENRPRRPGDSVISINTIDPKNFDYIGYFDGIEQRIKKKIKFRRRVILTKTLAELVMFEGLPDFKTRDHVEAFVPVNENNCFHVQYYPWSEPDLDLFKRILSTFEPIIREVVSDAQKSRQCHRWA